MSENQLSRFLECWLAGSEDYLTSGRALGTIHPRRMPNAAVVVAHKGRE